MVFSALRPSDKEAFFALLDEYFLSRPGMMELKPSRGHTTEPTSTMSNPAIPRSRLKDTNILSQGPQPHPPRSVSGTSSAGALPPRTVVPPASTPGKLVSQKKFGDVDVTSGKNMFASLRHSTANKTAVPPPVTPAIPSAFGQKKTTFAPPPTRRLPTSSPSTGAETQDPTAAVEARGSVAEHTKMEGEWAEALYDYNSEDPGDLCLRENARVLITDKTSDDWWTGEMDGNRGLFPAAYVKLL